MLAHITLCYMVVGDNLNAPLNLVVSFAKALMEQGFPAICFGEGQPLKQRRVNCALGKPTPAITTRPCEPFLFCGTPKMATLTNLRLKTTPSTNRPNGTPGEVRHDKVVLD